MSQCDRIEALAGAIALGEASEEERQAYRLHIAQCARCLQTFGGEREIERVVRTVVEARDSEIWNPEIKDVLVAGSRRRVRVWRIAGACVTALLLVEAGMRGLAPRHPVLAPPEPRIVAAAATAPPARSAPLHKPLTAHAVPPQNRLIVEHNVVQIAPVEASLPAPPAVEANVTPAPIAEVTVHAPPAQTSPRRGVSKARAGRHARDTDAWRTVAMTTTTSLSESAPETVSHRAELLQISSAQRQVREAAPVGGETAIAPRPAMIAYEEGAQGTSVFQVLIDEHGAPTRCLITKTSGYSVLDIAVCKAAMQVRYVPKTVDGRAVPGSYTDAFTFRMTNNDIEGIPKQIQ